MSLLNILLSTSEILIIVFSTIAGLIFIALAIFLFEKFFLARRRCERIILKLEEEYDTYHTILIGKDTQLINRLELISRTNLFYGDIHATYFRRLKEIRETYDNDYRDSVNNLRDLLNDNEIKEFKKYYAQATHIFSNYKDSIDSLNTDLTNLIKPEDEARQNSLNLKEKFREVKSKYNTYENELSFLANSFNRVFDTIEQRFTEYDSKVDSAKYEEAKEMLPELEKVLETLTSLIIKFPSILEEINKILPDEIKDVKQTYEELLKKGFPLKTFNIEDAISTLNYDLEKIRDKVKDLRVAHVDEEIEAIHNGINTIRKSFKEEQDSREIFEESNANINALFQGLEAEFIKISNNLPKFKKFYIIDDDHAKEFENIKNKLSEVGKDKRRLEIYIYQMGQTPYKVLVEKMHDLDAGTQDLKGKIQAFINYLSSLKDDSESAFKLIEGQFTKLKTYEAILRSDFTDTISERFNSKFDQAYVYIDKIFELLNSLPIDVVKLNEVTNKLTNLSSNIFNEIDELGHYKNQSIDIILTGNRNRDKFSDISTLLDQAEKFYMDGNFKKAYELGSQALNSLKAKDGIND